MSDWNILEIGDNVFDELCDSIGDHKVPFQGGNNSANSLLANSQHGTENAFRKTAGSRGSRRTNGSSNKKKATGIAAVQTSNHGGLKGLNPHVSGMVMPASFQANSPTILASQGLQMPNNTNKDKICAEVPYIEFRAGEDESEIGNFSLDNISSADAGLSFLENDKDRENDFLHCDWNDIGNFDDIDKMFRNCDPTYGQQTKTDTSSCFSYSSMDIHGSVVANNATVPSSSSDLGAFDSTTLVQSTETMSYCPEDCLLDIDDKQPCPMYSSFELVPNADQVYARVPVSGHQSSSEEHRKFGKTHSQDKHVGEQYMFPGSRQDRFSDPYPYQVIGTSDYMPTFISHSDNEDRTTSYQDHLMQINSGAGTQSNSCTYDTSFQHHNNAYEPETANITYLDSCTTHESLSAAPNDQDDGNIEKAISLKQLQNAMDQLDTGTKLCIRNSLYRLARSAEQRQNSASTSTGSNKRKTGALSKGKSRQMEYVGMETDTNPIDRSIAQLLFYRPAETAAKPAANESQMNSQQIHGQLPHNR